MKFVEQIGQDLTSESFSQGTICFSRFLNSFDLVAVDEIPRDEDVRVRNFEDLVRLEIVEEIKGVVLGS